MNKSRSAKWQRRLIQPPRAVIDIGSNTVRMVIYEGTAVSYTHLTLPTIYSV